MQHFFVSPEQVKEEKIYVEGVRRQSYEECAPHEDR